jgi:citronellol/citronellal dehydrogenase
MREETCMSLKGKTLFITGGSRGIGLAIALKAARDGANVTIAAKTAEPHPKLEGTIYTAAEEIEAAGGKCLPLMVDVREEQSVAERDRQDAVERLRRHRHRRQQCQRDLAEQHRPDTDMKRFDLMHQINTRGTFMVSKYAIPHLRASEGGRNPHILMLSPPLDMKMRWFAPHLAYTMAKYGMSLCVLGLAGELAPKGIAVNALWPRTTIATAAVRNLLGGDNLMVQASRTPEIWPTPPTDLQEAVTQLLRQFPDRRQLPGRRGRHRLHVLTGSTRRCR